MDWIEVKITTNHESVELISYFLLENNIQGWSIDDDMEFKEFIENREASWDFIEDELLERNNPNVIITFYVSENGYGLELLNGVKNCLNNVNNESLDFAFEYSLDTSSINEEDWVNNWKKYYKPFKLGNIVVKPTWEEYDLKDDEILLEIDPGHVFGTGLHHSTAMCIEQSQKFVNENDEILDLGCGSGILSIVGLLLKGKNALAVDIDENAEKVAYENADLNNIDKSKYEVLTGNILTDEPLVNKITVKQYDVVFANIVADVIIGISDFVKNCIKDSGYYIMSGIIDDREQDVLNKLEEIGCEIVEAIHREGWVCLVARKK